MRNEGVQPQPFCLVLQGRLRWKRNRLGGERVSERVCEVER